MRIVSGRFKGMSVAVPKTGDVRPTQDRVRESLFATLAPELEGAVFADLFAGSGAAGLEALSRGAKRAVFVERDRRHAAVVEKNIVEARKRGLAPSAAAVVVRDAFAWAGGGGERADIVFADPPYSAGEEGAERKLLDALASSFGVLARGGLFVCETPSHGGGSAQVPPRAPEAVWRLLREREYGASRIRIWRLAEPEGAVAR